MEELKREIERLKKSRKAVILAHNYQIDEVQEIADFTGDSLELARYAAGPAASADTIVLCGVYFMAETAAILNPSKKVLIPDETSGCPLADMITAPALEELKSKHPAARVVCYVNSTAEVKAAADICCTSSNAVRVVESLGQGEVIFAPDRNLGDYVRRKTGRDMIVWDGFCPTHDRVAAAEFLAAKAEHPDAVSLAHPECRAEVLALADEVASTSGMLRYVAASSAREFIIGTESGILYRLKKENPSKKFYLASPKLVCPNMKKNDLHKIHRALASVSPAVCVEPALAAPALAAIEKMLAVR